jgi:acyl-CoA synthetase (NDP forming)
VAGPGGGASILSADACDRAGLELRPVDAAVQARLRAEGWGAGTSVANPIEVGIGPAAAADTFDRLLEPILAAQSFPDVLLHVNVQSFYSFGDEGASRLLEMLDRIAQRRWPGRVAVVLRNVECAPPEDAARCRKKAIECRLPVFRDFDEAMVAIGAAKRFTHQRLASATAAAIRRR